MSDEVDAREGIEGAGQDSKKQEEQGFGDIGALLGSILDSKEGVSQLYKLFTMLPSDNSSPGNAEGEKGGLSPELLFGLFDIIGAMNGEGEAEKLILALEPFMSRERASRISDALKYMKLARLAKAAMKLLGNSEGLFGV